MAAFDFPPNAAQPNPPQVGDKYTPPGSGITYEWNGTVWNATIASGLSSVTEINAGAGITCTPDPIIGVGSVAVDNTVLRTTGDQTKTGTLTDYSGFFGPITGGQFALTDTVSAAGTQIGSITTQNTKFTIATTDAALGIQFVAPADQYVDIISVDSRYARFNNATEELQIGGTIPGTPGIILGGTAVTATSFIGNASTATALATARDISVTLTGNATGTGTTAFDGSSNITITVPVVLDDDVVFWDRTLTVLSPSNAGDTIYTSGDIVCGGTGTGDAPIVLDASTGTVTATSFEGDGSKLTGLPRSVVFKGAIDATSNPAPTNPQLGDIYVNDTAGTIASEFTPIDGDAIALNQFIFYAADAGSGAAGWVLGGVSDVSQYVTLATNQTIAGEKTFTGLTTLAGVSNPLQTISASAFDLDDGPNWTVGAVTVPNPTNAVAGQVGSIIVTAAPTGWGANFKFPSPDNGVTDGTAPSLTNFPVVLPYIVQNPTTILIGNPTVY